MTNHVVLAYFSGNAAPAAHVVPCVLRVGVWAVAKNTRGPVARWQVIHAPSGMWLRDCATKREASRVCRKLGRAFGMMAFDCGFGSAPLLPSKVARVAGVKVLEQVA